MTCPDPTVRMLFVHWLFNGFQVIGVIVVWTILKVLWKMIGQARRRLTKSRDKV